METLEHRSAPLEVRGPGGQLGDLQSLTGARARVKLADPAEHVQETFVSRCVRGGHEEPSLSIVEHGGQAVMGEVTAVRPPRRGLRVYLVPMKATYRVTAPSSASSFSARQERDTSARTCASSPTQSLEGVASCRLSRSYQGRRASRSANGVQLVDASSKAQWPEARARILRNLLSTDAVDVVADTTPNYGAPLRLIERGTGSGTYPERTPEQIPRY